MFPAPYRISTETEKSCHFIDALCSREDLKELLPEQCTLFPPDVMKVCEPPRKKNASFSTSTKQARFGRCMLIARVIVEAHCYMIISNGSLIEQAM